MTVTSIFLTLVATVLCVDGFAYALRPTRVKNDGMPLATDTLINISVMFGGVQLAIGLFIAWVVVKGLDTTYTLILLALVLTVVGIVRGGAALAHKGSLRQYVATVGELAIAVFSGYLAL